MTKEYLIGWEAGKRGSYNKGKYWVEEGFIRMEMCYTTWQQAIFINKSVNIT